ncbi:MAG: LPS-assembly protein LptD, partial [Anaerovibrio slackiae]|nr:LPS-assembly protein LptD [Anaerovibrio slackiae]
MLKNKEKICRLAAGLVVAITFASGSVAKNLPQAEAMYNSESDTDATILDSVENCRRNARENALNEDQKQLLLDAYEMKENLREPLDPTKNVPVAVEGDELFYDENTGDFVVQGNVVMTSLDKRRFITEHADGNLASQDVQVEDKAYMLQLTDAQARIILNGYKTQYNWGKETGKMENAEGKIDHQYVKAKRIEFYPDKVVLYNASATKCSAKNPDYHMTAKKIEYYPGIQTISYGVSYWLGSIPVYSVPKQVSKEGDKGPYMPKASYDNDKGFA